MPSVFLDRVDTLEADEVRGVLMRVVRKARIGGLTNTDWSVLVEALDAIGLAAGTPLPDPHDALKLVRRSPSLVPGQKSWVDVRLEYEREDLTPNWEGDVHAAQVNDMRDENGDPLVLDYKYPETYELDPDLEGETVSVVATFPTTKTLTELSGTFVVATGDPVALADFLANKVNSDIFLNGLPRTWKVTRVSYREFDRTTSKWQFTVSIVHDPDGHDPTVAFVDPNTNEHPPDVFSQSSAWRVVPKLQAIPFGLNFGQP